MPKKPYLVVASEPPMPRMMITRPAPMKSGMRFLSAAALALLSTTATAAIRPS